MILAFVGGGPPCVARPRLLLTGGAGEPFAATTQSLGQPGNQAHKIRGFWVVDEAPADVSDRLNP